MAIRLSDSAQRHVALLADVTGVTARDCIVDDHDQVWFVIPPDEVAAVVGPGGETVERVEERIGKRVRIVEWDEDPGRFVANALAPAAVYNVTISEPPAGADGGTDEADDGTADGEGDRIAYVEVDPDDRGVAIGTEGRTIEPARELAERHHDVDDVRLV